MQARFITDIYKIRHCNSLSKEHQRISNTLILRGSYPTSRISKNSRNVKKISTQKILEFLAIQQQPYCTRKNRITKTSTPPQRSSSNYPDIAVEKTNSPYLQLLATFYPPPEMAAANQRHQQRSHEPVIPLLPLPSTNQPLPSTPSLHHHQSPPVQDYPSKSIFSPQS